MPNIGGNMNENDWAEVENIAGLSFDQLIEDFKNKEIDEEDLRNCMIILCETAFVVGLRKYDKNYDLL
jgi:hypothetical protein